MPRRIPLALAVVLGMVLPVLVGAPTAQSASRALYFTAAAAGSQITALGAAVSSDPTASSSVSGFEAPAADTNRVAGAPGRILKERTGLPARTVTEIAVAGTYILG